MRHLLALGFLIAATPALAQNPPAGGAITVNAGPVTGSGQLTDSSGRAIGTWAVTAVLKAGAFTGSGVISINGTSVSMPLNERRSYLENGRCYFQLEQGRSHANLGGPCTSAGIVGTLNAFIPEGDVGSVSGRMSGPLKFGAAVMAKAPAAGVLPTVKLTCAWMERIGGNYAGQDVDYQLRFSSMASLQLSANGTYRTANASGAYVRQGNTVRFTSGQYAGAVGRLEPDKSGQPAVYFERDENRLPNGVHIVDPARTSCTVARGG